MQTSIIHYFLSQISDFGLARWKQYSAEKSSSRSQNAGTVTHIPPENWRDIPNTKRSEKFDVYSFGVMLWEIFTQKSPFAPDGGMTAMVLFSLYFIGALLKHDSFLPQFRNF